MIPKTDDAKPERTPSIVTTIKATELIVTDGDSKWQSLSGGQLLYVENTETPWLRELSTGNMYILLSGRWFRSKSEEGHGHSFGRINYPRVSVKYHLNLQ